MGKSKDISLLQDLEAYYEGQGILSTNFTCPHKHQCSAGCEKFTGPKSAFVSTGYERNDLPRLMFISLDSGRGDQLSEKRLPSAVRSDVEYKGDFAALAKRSHWYRTIELAWYILRRFEPELQMNQTVKFFANVNSAKCSMNKPQNAQADNVLFQNCKGFLSGEVELLRPAVVVTQGAKAREAFASLRHVVVRQMDDCANLADCAKEIEINSRKVFWLCTYHPNARGGQYHKQLRRNKETKIAEGWVRYADMIYDFMNRVEE